MFLWVWNPAICEEEVVSKDSCTERLHDNTLVAWLVNFGWIVFLSKGKEFDGGQNWAFPGSIRAKDTTKSTNSKAQVDSKVTGLQDRPENLKD